MTQKQVTAYNLNVEYDGEYNDVFDAKIQKLIRKRASSYADGSYGDGRKDHEIFFTFKTEASAINARRKLKNRFRSKIRCYIYEDRN